MTQPLLRFEIFGFTVNVQHTFALLLGVFALFDLQNQVPLWGIATFGVIVFTSIVIHELGHAAMARSLKVRVGEIHLHGMGGHVTHAHSKPRNNLLISLAGPGAGLAVGLPLLALYIWGPFDSWEADLLFSQLLFVNVGWSLFNLAPMAPLDGGNALRSALQLRMGPTRAEKLASIVGMVTAGLVAAYGFTVGWTILALFGAYFGWMNYQRYQRLAT